MASYGKAVRNDETSNCGHQTSDVRGSGTECRGNQVRGTQGTESRKCRVLHGNWPMEDGKKQERRGQMAGESRDDPQTMGNNEALGLRCLGPSGGSEDVSTTGSDYSAGISTKPCPV